MINFKIKMMNRKRIGFFTYVLLAVVLLSSCNNTPKDIVWYGNNGMKVESKATNDKQYGKWKYIVKDNFGEVLIRTNEEWNVGDTLYVGKH